ncbi:protein ULTRAPETALA 2-like [Andrographis paniculata]|uniref:protein ULTRAPETALA 2-like n=1 Tax=Andrographis paniculata TaxID=175694 RepID=UPI0021E9A2F7|nr:protein ULTRAPETALA 2-like [Andrographis paniculata]
MFTQAELFGFIGILQITTEFLVMKCGCTNSRYGDTSGKLKIYFDGRIEINCTCDENCSKVNVSPIEFARHALRTNSDKYWKSQIWVFGRDGSKVQLVKTCLLKFFKDTYQRPIRQAAHRDEFVRCSLCRKERRFTNRTRDDSRNYHRALASDNWKCSDMPNQELSCDDAEERESRKAVRGCPKNPKCTGCTKCVCNGCDMCRFDDCDCQECTSFILNM